MGTEQQHRVDRVNRPRRVTDGVGNPRGWRVGVDVTKSAVPVPAKTRSPTIERRSEIIDFVHRWYAYGGGSDYDIFIQFGLPARDFFRRAARLLGEEGHFGFAPKTLAAMQDVCAARLAGEGRRKA